MKAMMGKVTKDAFGALLGTGMNNFKAHCGIEGLARETGEELHVLAVVARRPGSGQFRKFVELAKKNYAEVFMWEVWNADVEAALLRYGFAKCDSVQWGERINGYVWRKA